MKPDDDLEFLDYNPLGEKPESLDKDKKPEEEVEVTVRDPITRHFKKVKTRRIRRHDFYSDGKLIDG